MKMPTRKQLRPYASWTLRAIVIYVAVSYAYNQWWPSPPITYTGAEFERDCAALEDERERSNCSTILWAGLDSLEYAGGLSRIYRFDGSTWFFSGRDASIASSPYLVPLCIPTNVPRDTYGDLAMIRDATLAYLRANPEAYDRPLMDSVIYAMNEKYPCQTSGATRMPYYGYMLVRDVDSLCSNNEKVCTAMVRASVSARQYGTAIGFAVPGPEKEPLNLDTFRYSEFEWRGPNTGRYCLAHRRAVSRVARQVYRNFLSGLTQNYHFGYVVEEAAQSFWNTACKNEIP